MFAWLQQVMRIGINGEAASTSGSFSWGSRPQSRSQKILTKSQFLSGCLQNGPTSHLLAACGRFGHLLTQIWWYPAFSCGDPSRSPRKYSAMVSLARALAQMHQPQSKSYMAVSANWVLFVSVLVLIIITLVILIIVTIIMRRRRTRMIITVFITLIVMIIRALLNYSRSMWGPLMFGTSHMNPASSAYTTYNPRDTLHPMHTQSALS